MTTRSVCQVLQRRELLLNSVALACELARLKCQVAALYGDRICLSFNSMLLSFGRVKCIVYNNLGRFPTSISMRIGINYWKGHRSLRIAKVSHHWLNRRDACAFWLLRGKYPQSSLVLSQYFSGEYWKMAFICTLIQRRWQFTPELYRMRVRLVFRSGAAAELISGFNFCRRVLLTDKSQQTRCVSAPVWQAGELTAGSQFESKRVLTPAACAACLRWSGANTLGLLFWRMPEQNRSNLHQNRCGP